MTRCFNRLICYWLFHVAVTLPRAFPTDNQTYIKERVYVCVWFYMHTHTHTCAREPRLWRKSLADEHRRHQSQNWRPLFFNTWWHEGVISEAATAKRRRKKKLMGNGDDDFFTSFPQKCHVLCITTDSSDSSRPHTGAVKNIFTGVWISCDCLFHWFTFICFLKINLIWQVPLRSDLC